MALNVDQQVGGRLSLHIPATADVECSCFCWNKKTPQSDAVVIRGNSLVSVRRADVAQTAVAVQAIYDEVMRRCHPDAARASQVFQRAGLSMTEQPQVITTEQLAIIRSQLED